VLTRAQQALIPTLVFVVVAATHMLGIATSFDSVWSIPIARSILYERNVDLDEYAALLTKHHYYAIESIAGHVYSIFPVGASLVALLVVALLDTAGIRPHDNKTEKLVASLVVALTTVLLYSLARGPLDVARTRTATACSRTCCSTSCTS